MKYRDRLIFDPFFGDFFISKNEVDSNFDEAVVNLFLELQTSTITNFDNLGVKLKEIEARI